MNEYKELFAIPTSLQFLFLVSLSLCLSDLQLLIIRSKQIGTPLREPATERIERKERTERSV
tara:strand:- start:344 stop:529 length:186 start_codon:yes stop_codon:yes gene_type:complete